MKVQAKFLAVIMSALLLAGCAQGTQTASTATQSTAGNDSTTSVNTNSNGCTVTVNASYQLDVVPDIAYIKVGYVCSGTSSSKIVKDNATVIDKIVSALKAKGLTDAEIDTDSFNVYPTYNYENGTSTIKGYTASHVLKVTINDISKIGDIIDAAVAGGANQSMLVSYDIKDYNTQYNKALTAAIAKGNSKADAIAKSLGATSYKLNKITESNTSYTPVTEYATKSSDSMAGSTQIQTGNITITAQLTMEFSINK